MEIDLLLARSTPSDKGEDVSGKRGTHLSPLIAQPHSIFLSRLLLKRQQGITDDVYTLRFFRLSSPRSIVSSSQIPSDGTLFKNQSIFFYCVLRSEGWELICFIMYK